MIISFLFSDHVQEDNFASAIGHDLLTTNCDFPSVNSSTKEENTSFNNEEIRSFETGSNEKQMDTIIQGGTN